MTNRKDAPKHITTKDGKIKGANKFKYMRQLIQPNAIDREAKEKVTFYGHIKIMNEESLTKILFNYFDRNPNTQITWIKEVRKEMKLDGEEMERRKEFREKIRGFRGFHVQEKSKKKTRTKWTEEKKKQHSERMKEYWKRRKKNNCHKLFHVVHSRPKSKEESTKA
ncbi:hypothetical protein RI129_000436 [Pyrocoelia pectoralis]|uniref:Uncharacterized protein n=1 Tax=Pyrocoelia pectoralis TaxID=417401 RepID=A0AAN7VJ64_9COLE